MGKKKKETFQEFRSNEKSAYTTIKTTLKSSQHLTCKNLVMYEDKSSKHKSSIDLLKTKIAELI